MKHGVAAVVCACWIVLSVQALAVMRFTHASEEAFVKELVEGYTERSLDELVLGWMVEENASRRMLLIAAIVSTRDLVGADEEMRNLVFLVSRIGESERSERLKELQRFRKNPSVASKRLRELLRASKKVVPDRLNKWASGGLRPWGPNGDLRTD